MFDIEDGRKAAVLVALMVSQDSSWLRLLCARLFGERRLITAGGEIHSVAHWRGKDHWLGSREMD